METKAGIMIFMPSAPHPPPKQELKAKIQPYPTSTSKFILKETTLPICDIMESALHPNKIALRPEC